MQARCPNHTRIKEVTGAVALGGDGLYIRHQRRVVFAIDTPAVASRIGLMHSP
jgi:hypothetical protein